MIKSNDVGTIQYIEWLTLIDRVQPSFLAGVNLLTLVGHGGAGAEGRAERAVTQCINMYQYAVYSSTVCHTGSDADN